MLDDIPALEPSLSHKSSLLARVRRQQVAKNLPDFIFSGLAALGCSDKEISTLTRCPIEDLKDKAQPISEGKARLKHALRKAQLKAALKGNPSMLIWLGKAILGQSEQPSAAPQHTNIVVTADLLSNLQRSYESTLSDIRRSKTLPDYLDNQPAPLIAFKRGTLSDTLTASESSASECDVESVTPQSKPLPLQGSGLANSLRESEPCDEAETRPPAGPPPTRTPTPIPKRLVSRGSGNLKKGGKPTKWAQYAVGQTAERWSSSLKKLKGTRGGSREEGVTQEEGPEK